MPKDPCVMFVKQAKKNIGLFKKNFWTAGLYFLQAAECYKNSGNKAKAYEYAKEAVDCLYKYWAGTNDMVLSDLEKALSLAYYNAPKKSRKSIGKKAFEVYTYHAKKLESAGNYLGAAEKYEASVQFAPSGIIAREILLRAISILENALQKEHVIKNKALVEKIEKKLEDLKKMVPPITVIEKKAPSEVETQIKYIVVFSVFKSPMDQAISSFSNEFSLPISEFKITKRAGSVTIRFAIPGYSAYVLIDYMDTECNVEINSSNISFVAEIASMLRYYFDDKDAIKLMKEEKIVGKYKARDLVDFAKKIMRFIKGRDKARKIAYCMYTLAVALGKIKKYRELSEDLKLYAHELLDLYIRGKNVLPVDAEKAGRLIKLVLENISKR